ncbi:sperm-associated antigen 16 protein-like [Xiphophorus maculatus]|uniref:Sperm-associated antigen 16 protein-like n=1 Tax=Xiphophorus maculatus TaxID=8083 RepID=A0A3B5PQY3_XIPMA|nr:sperm-associated antigen 16 protein-like [Xiphophorus maculatus]
MSAKKKDKVEEKKDKVEENCDSIKEEDEDEEKEEEEKEEEEEEEEDGSSSSSASSSPVNPEDPVVQDIPESVEDFLRNFLRKLGLTRTLSLFELEWHSRARGGGGGIFVPDALTHRQALLEKLEAVRGDAEQLRKQVLTAAQSLLRMQQESDYHRQQHRRLSEQKHVLTGDCKQLQEQLQDSQEALKRLRDKHEAALRTKTLLGLQKERAQRLPEPEPETPSRKPPPSSPSGAMEPCGLPAGPEAPEKSSFQLFCSFRAHQLPISGVAPHPGRPLLASASDDRTWRLWDLPRSGEKVARMLLIGEGHSDWLSGCSFHPEGSRLATTSGDKTVRLWDFSACRCVLLLAGHSQPTWGSSFHSGGHILASCSADGTARMWDPSRGCCRMILRRHGASVNSVAFLPCSDLLLTSSADKTVVVWDGRLGVSTATFRGHRHPCNHAAFSPTTNAVASCDSRGTVHLWDTRKPAAPTGVVDAGPHAANQVAFNQSGKLLAVASGDCLVRLVEAESCGVSSLAGHRKSVQSVTFDLQGGTLMSAGSDGLINVWL